MPRPAELIEDDAGDIDIAVKRLITQDQGRDTPRHAACIDDQYHRCLQEFGEGGVAVAAIQVEDIIKAFVAFDDADIRLRGFSAESGEYFIVTHEIEIEDMARAGAGQA